MLIGGGATCPGCKQTDSTILVSLLVHQALDELSPEEVDKLFTAANNGVMREWDLPVGEVSWAEFAKKISLPLKPERGFAMSGDLLLPARFLNLKGLMYRDWYSDFAWIGMLPFGLSLMSCLAACSLFMQSEFTLAALLFVVAFLTSFGMISLIMWAQQKYSQAIDRWGVAQDRWDDLWYCSRDNAVFIGGQHKLIPTNQVKALLYKPESKI